MKIDMNFKLFVEIMTNEVLDFEKIWEIDEWNISYIDFKKHCQYYYAEEYVRKTEPKQLVIEWGKEYYKFAKEETHNYWVKLNAKTK